MNNDNLTEKEKEEIKKKHIIHYIKYYYKSI